MYVQGLSSSSEEEVVHENRLLNISISVLRLGLRRIVSVFVTLLTSLSLRLLDGSVGLGDDTRTNLGLWSHEDRHRLAFHPRRLLDNRQIFRFFQDLEELTLSGFRMRDLAATETARDFDLVAILEETSNMTDFHFHIVIVGLRSELDFFELDLDLTLFRVIFPFLLFVFKPPKIHDFADGRHGFGVDLDEVEFLFACEAERLVRRKHPKHLAFGSDDTDFGNADAMIGPRTGECCALARVEAGTDSLLPPAGRALALHDEQTAMMERLRAAHKPPLANRRLKIGLNGPFRGWTTRRAEVRAARIRA